MEVRSKSGLAIVLSQLEGFTQPKVMAEQYATDSEVAAEFLWFAAMKGDLKQKVSADLGCGTGILGIGALLLGAKKVYFVDSDAESVEIARKNLKNAAKMAKSESSLSGRAVFLRQDIAGFTEKVDVVLENPPFGTKERHADRVFLEKAMELAPVVYSLHKSESKGFVEALAGDHGFKVTNVLDFEMPLKATMKMHEKRIYRVKVSLFRMERAV
ncbi:methyltransferase [Candidatus Woesearchaeota archaeon]|nr:methyltransferase [Candidatus Woesearchaeota archaeon]